MNEYSCLCHKCWESIIFFRDGEDHQTRLCYGCALEEGREEQHNRTVAELKAKIAKQNSYIGCLEAAHNLLAHEEAFASPQGGSPFFICAEISTNGVPMLSLNMSDVFYYACADCEPFHYEDAPELLAIAKTQGWDGIVKWVSEQRARRGEHSTPIRPREDGIDRFKQVVAERDRLNERVKELELLLAERKP